MEGREVVGMEVGIEAVIGRSNRSGKVPVMSHHAELGMNIATLSL